MSKENKNPKNLNPYEIHWYDISQLKEASYNPRFITTKSLEGLKNSISTFGLLDPIVFNKRTNNIVSGHQRYKAAQELELEKIPVIEVDIDENTEIKLNLTLNNPHIQGQFIPDQVSRLLSQIENDNFFAELNLGTLQADFNSAVAEIDPTIPNAFDEVDDSNMSFSHKCPKCGFEFTEKGEQK